MKLNKLQQEKNLLTRSSEVPDNSKTRRGTLKVGNPVVPKGVALALSLLGYFNWVLLGANINFDVILFQNK